MLNKVDWWVAYTRGTADYLVRNGVAPDKITAVQNSVDTTSFVRDLAQVEDVHLMSLRARLGLTKEAAVGLFCGSLHRDKRIAFLLEAAQLVKKSVPDFHLIVVGAGPEAAVVKQWARHEPWVHYVGPKFGTEKAALFKMSDLFLMPGLVGLAILDAFAAGLPVVTTDIPIHSPEIEYLENGINGVMTPHTTECYARAVVELLSSPAMRQRISQGAAASAAKYSIDAMVENFRGGIHKCFAS